MKRDMDLVRQILLDLSESNESLPASVFKTSTISEKTVGYNMVIMAEAGLINITRTGAVLLMRKMLVHLAVAKNAKESISFSSAVKYLDEHGWIPPTGKQWVDKIRTIGNDATHQVVVCTKREAEQLLRYVEHLLISIYEFPAKVQETK